MSIVEVHPSWVAGPDEAPQLSDTWRWFHLEPLTQSVPASPLRDIALRVDPSWPLGYGSLLKSAAWMIVEAVFRDGSARSVLGSDDMRWARRLGLALMGDLPASVRQGGGGGAGPLGPRRRASGSNDVHETIDFFPAADQSVLWLALGPDGTSSQRRCSSELFGLPRAKAELLARLAKRHAAASMGVELAVTERLPSKVHQAPAREALERGGAAPQVLAHDLWLPIDAEPSATSDPFALDTEGQRREPRFLEASA